MLEMLLILPEFRVSNFIRHHFEELFALSLPSFNKYLKTSIFKHHKMQKTHSLPWKFEDEDEFFIDHHTSYIGQDFISKHFDVCFERPDASKMMK